MVGKGTSLMDAFKVCDDVLRQGIQGISDLISQPSLINLDFADVRTTMQEKGLAHMGIGIGTGENRAMEAARQAISSPLLETTIDGAKAVLINITGDSSLGLIEIEEAASLIAESSDPEANIIFGAGIDDTMHDQARITVIATGFDSGRPPLRKPLENDDNARPQRMTQEEPQQRYVRPQPQRQPATGMQQPQFDAPYQQYNPEPVRNTPQYMPEDDYDTQEYYSREPQVRRVQSREPAPPYGAGYGTLPDNQPPVKRQAPPQDDEDDLDVPPFLRRRR